MRKYAVALMVLLIVAAFTGTVSAKARGYGLVFGGAEHGAMGGGIPDLALPAQAGR